MVGHGTAGLHFTQVGSDVRFVRRFGVGHNLLPVTITRWLKALSESSITPSSNKLPYEVECGQRQDCENKEHSDGGSEPLDNAEVSGRGCVTLTSSW